jgi:dienelactone hydrolase
MELFDQGNDYHALITQPRGLVGGGDAHWHEVGLRNIYLVSLKDGTRKLVQKDTRTNYSFTPTGKFLQSFDSKLGQYLTYEVNTGIKRICTIGDSTIWTNDRIDRFPIAGYDKDDRNVYLYDLFDIWKVDPQNINAPFNLTREVGRRDSIIFEAANARKFILDSNLILSAFDLRTKKNGFFKLESNGKLTELSMFDSLFCAFSIGLGNPVEKASASDSWLVKRESAEASPNLFWTNDFKHFKPLTSLKPENQFNWLKSELHTFNMPDGTLRNGILYKPENFDPKKKYPVIFYFYQELSNQLHRYTPAMPSDGRLNIPYYVSNGYLVFTPDIVYKIGSPGESALRAVTSAANYLCQLPYVNPSKLGLQGISWGSFQTNYIVSHSNLFAAACSTSGQTDLISLYGSLSNIFSGASFAGYNEIGQGRMGSTLYDRPDLYIANSPIIAAKNITTPMLLMYNKPDSINFVQGVQLFTALRRMGKKGWMLQYKDGGHGVYGVQGLDFDIRMKQFFDYYLKDTLPPKWMIEVLPRM